MPHNYASHPVSHALPLPVSHLLLGAHSHASQLVEDAGCREAQHAMMMISCNMQHATISLARWLTRRSPMLTWVGICAARNGRHYNTPAPPCFCSWQHAIITYQIVGPPPATVQRELVSPPPAQGSLHVPLLQVWSTQHAAPPEAHPDPAPSKWRTMDCGTEPLLTQASSRSIASSAPITVDAHSGHRRSPSRASTKRWLQAAQMQGPPPSGSESSEPQNCEDALLPILL